MPIREHDAPRIEIAGVAPRDTIGRAAPACEPFTHRVGRACWIIAIGAVAAQTVVHLVNTLALKDAHWSLNVNYEGTVFSWASTGLTGAAAVIAFLVWLVDPGGSRRFAVLAVALAYLSLDDGIQLHERFSQEVAAAFDLPSYSGRLTWPFLLGSVLLVVAVILVSLRRRLPRPERVALAAALGLFAVAIGLEMVSSLLVRAGHGEDTDALYAVESALEEGAELGAWILVLPALVGELARGLWARQPVSAGS